MVRVDPAINNGSPEAPGVITRVFGEHPQGGWVINVRVFVDADVSPPSKTSIQLLDEQPADDDQHRHVAWWPPRV